MPKKKSKNPFMEMLAKQKEMAMSKKAPKKKAKAKKGY